MSQWGLVEALEYAWKELRAMPVPASSHIAPPLSSVLSSIAAICREMQDRGTDKGFDVELKGLATEFCLLELAVNSEVLSEQLRRIRAGFIDARTDMADW
jgi:hypothetical protein